jgi:hypothetical protein
MWWKENDTQQQKSYGVYAVFYFAGNIYIYIYIYTYDVITSPEKEKRSTYHYLQCGAMKIDTKQ